MDQEHIKVLLIEDNPGDARLIREIMNEEKNISLDLKWTSFLEEGLEFISSGEVDVVLLDLGLPDSQGFETFAKTYAINPQLPIIVLSGLEDEDLAIKAVRNGAQDYLVKGQVNGNLIVRTLRYSIERKRIEEKLLESEKKFRNLYESSKDGIGFWDMQGNLLDANSAFLDMLGYKKKEIKKLTFQQLTPKKWHKMEEHIVKKQIKARGHSDEYEKDYIRKDGTIFPASIRLWLTKDEQGKPMGMWAIIRDITERRRSEKELQKSFKKLRRTLGETVKALASLVDIKDPYTAGHQQRVTKLALAIAREMGLPEEQIEGIKIAGSIHDIGKITIPAEFLSKPTPLDEHEILIIQNHPRVGYEILKGIEFPWPVAEIVLQHHERMLGSGYPQGLSGEDILLEARILGVADVVEAMSSHRPYRPAYGIEKALEEISRNRGMLYDPIVVDTCIELFMEKEFKFEGD